MELTGHIHNGVVVFDGGTIPPEGTRVTVEVPTVTTPVPFGGLRPLVPLVTTGEPGSWKITDEMIADFFEQEDIEYMKGMFDAPS